MRKLIKTLFFLVILSFIIPLAHAEETITDSYLNENYIENYNQILVNTTAGEVLLDYDYYNAFTTARSYDFNGTNYFISDDSLNDQSYVSKCVAYWYRIENGETVTNYEWWDVGFAWLFKQGTNDNQLYMYNSTHGLRYRGFTMDNDGDDHFKVLNLVYASGQPSHIEEYDDNVLTQNRTSWDYASAFANDLFIEIARSSNTGGIPANYTVDHFQLYNRTMTTTEISRNWNNGKGLDHPYNETDLLIFYDFNDDSSIQTDRKNFRPGDIVFYDSSGHIDDEIVLFDYYSDGLLYSVNFVDGLNTTAINQVNYEGNLPVSNTTAYIQFSENNSTWYASNGVLNAWDTVSNSTNSLNLKNLGFTSNFFYRLSLNTTDVYYTPKLYYLAVIYEESMTEITIINLVFVLLLSMLAFGILGLFKPIIALGSMAITLMVVLPQIATLDAFLINLSVGVIFFQAVFFALGCVRNR